MALKLNTNSLTLNTGSKIPQIGFGSMLTSKDAILQSLKEGCRHIDTAAIYGNEDQVGQAIAESKIPREEIFITTKLWNTRHKDVAAALDESLAKLGTDYVDLYLIHWAWSEIEGTDHEVYQDWDFVDTYKELQKIYKSTNKIKTLGVSNFTIAHLEKLFNDKEVDIVPAVNQIEAHPLLKQPKLTKYLQDKNIVIEAYSPLGGTGTFVFQYPEVEQLAEKYGITPAQVLISWAVQRDTVVIPRSKTLLRVGANLLTLTLHPDDFEILNSLEDKYGTVRNNDAWRFTPGEE